MKSGKPAWDNQDATRRGLPDCWTFFDKIYCISVDARTDRRAEASRQFARVGLGGRVEFVLVRKHPVNQEQGIYDSHLLCLRRGIEAGGNHILIFEDDILFQDFDEGAIRAASAFLAARPQWTLFFLGALFSKSSPTETSSVREVCYRALTHAYAVNRPFADIIVNTPWHGIPYDLYLRRLQRDSYALYPSCAFQSNAPTDNQQRFVLDRFRRLCGGLARIQRINELWQRHKRLALLLHAAVLLGALLLLWRLS